MNGNAWVSRGQDGAYIEPFEEPMTFVANEIDGNLTIRGSQSERFEYRVVGTDRRSPDVLAEQDPTAGTGSCPLPFANRRGTTKVIR